LSHALYEWIYVGTVIALLTWVGADAWNVEHQLEAVPPNAQIIKVTGQQWFWTFEHADGTKEIGELHLKQGIPYRFEIVSKDVIHSFNIPDFTVLMDAVPGRVNTMWNNFDVPGQYLIQCREYCGLLHYNMRAKLFVEPPNSPSSTAGQAPSPSSEATPAAGAGTTNGTSATQVSGPVGATLNIAQGASIQGNPAFSPNPISVKKSSVVLVENKDSVPHTVTNGKGPDDPNSGKLFDTSIINAGESAKVDTSKLTSGQQYPFHCTVHPYMTGTLKAT
jgi:cytochrome c oxidase subunit 2